VVFLGFPSGGRYEVHLGQIIILLWLHLQQLGCALVELVGMCGCFKDVTGNGFRDSEYRLICTAGQHIGIKTVRAPVVRACGSGKRRIGILSTSIRRVHLLIPALDIPSGMRCPPVEVLVLRKHSLVVHSGQIHDLFGRLYMRADEAVEERRKGIGYPIISSESRHNRHCHCQSFHGGLQRFWGLQGVYCA